MDALARYVAGPVAVASLGVALLPTSPYAASPFWVLAAVWGACALREWRRGRLTLEQRTVQLANRIARCRPGSRDMPPHRSWSSYGPRASAMRMMIDLNHHKPSRWRRDHLPYTNRVQRKLEDILEEWGARGVKDPSRFERFVTGQRPQPAEYDTLASDLTYLASQTRR